MRFKALLFLLLSGILSVSCAKKVQSRWLHRCGEGLAGTVPYKWCIDTDPNAKQKSDDVLYFLHGAGGSEQNWFEHAQNVEIQEHWSKAQVAPPTVISVSFGPQWLLTEVVRGDRPTAMQLFLKEVMPQVEEKIGGVKGRRLLQGESMGGFNASQLLLKTDHLFERVALLCPGMSAVGPFASKQEVEDFFARNQPHINRDWVQRILEWMKSEFPTPQDWANHNAIEQASQLNGRSPATYVSCGQQDEYGFFEAAQKFVERANSRGASIQWEPMKGGHCVFNTQAIAEFFVPAKKAPKNSEGHSSLH